jgi:quinoprotein dehydrogenase-associated probable ABC transporter substrate-binding protein
MTRRLRFGACAGLAALLAVSCARHPQRVLGVCADPNNLPFSNEARQGFENKLAELLATDRGARLEYEWWAQRRGFVRNTLGKDACDVVMGVPAAFDPTLTTRPYYRSSYVFVWRRDRHLELGSFDDPRLRSLRIGVQMIGDDFANTPPAHALTNRGMVTNVVGYSVFGDYAQPSPLRAIVDAVDRGDVDTAVVWGPAAGYFARDKALELAPVSPAQDSPSLPFVFDIAMGVRRGNAALRDELNDFIARRATDIDRLLDDYNVPRAGN